MYKHMSTIFILGFIFLVIASLAAAAAAGSGNKARSRRSILVGDSQGWRAGTNYTQWAIKNSPFRINDTLVFKYPSKGNSKVVPSVYLLPNMWSYMTCEFRGAKLLGSAVQGGGEGLKIELNEMKPYYFASDEGNAYDCIAGLTKFIAVPSTRSF